MRYMRNSLVTHILNGGWYIRNVYDFSSFAIIIREWIRRQESGERPAACLKLRRSFSVSNDFLFFLFFYVFVCFFFVICRKTQKILIPALMRMLPMVFYWIYGLDPIQKHVLR